MRKNNLRERPLASLGHIKTYSSHAPNELFSLYIGYLSKWNVVVKLLLQEVVIDRSKDLSLWLI